MRTRDFNIDFLNILSKLVNKENFAFSKYADGEYAFLRNQKITNCDGWTFDPTQHQKEYGELMSSFTYSEEGYYIGISCPCCVPQEHVNWMRETVNVDDNHLTWANIFVNGNYKYFQMSMIPALKNDGRDIILVANKNSNIKNLPFTVNRFIGIGDTAWRDDFHLLETLPFEELNDKIYLFCAGPLGNMLAARMWKENKNNTYLDIGSTLNGFLGKPNRGYLKGASTLEKICVWE